MLTGCNPERIFLHKCCPLYTWDFVRLSAAKGENLNFSGRYCPGKGSRRGTGGDKSDVEKDTVVVLLALITLRCMAVVLGAEPLHNINQAEFIERRPPRSPLILRSTSGLARHSHHNTPQFR